MPLFQVRVIYNADRATIIGTAAHECVSEDALIHLKSYKYSSVDRSLLSYYILNPYVWKRPLTA